MGCMNKIIVYKLMITRRRYIPKVVAVTLVLSNWPAMKIAIKRKNQREGGF